MQKSLNPILDSKVRNSAEFPFIIRDKNTAHGKSMGGNNNCGEVRRNAKEIDKREKMAYKPQRRLPRMAKKYTGEQEEATREKLDSILQPSTKTKAFKITIVFGRKVSPNYDRAVDLAKRNPTYKEEGSGEWIRHSATYSPAEVEELFQLFNLVHER